MAKAKQNTQREHRIQQEIVVDAHNAEEQAMGWYYYLEEHLHSSEPSASPTGQSRPYAKARK
jgi:hypothetical protein